MDFRRLEAFSKVYELKGFSRAAESLFLSQPTVSAHIAALEAELGVSLFDRLGRTILATAAGDVLYEHALKVFDAMHKARAEIQLLQDKVSGDLVVGGSTIPAHYLLPGVLSSFVEKYPEVTVRMRVGDSTDIIQQVAQGKLAAGVVGVELKQPELTYVKLLQDDLVVIASAGNVQHAQEMSLEKLVQTPWVLRESGSGTFKALEAALAKAKFDIRNLKASVVVESTQAVIRCVTAGLGVSITSRMAAEDYLNRGELREITIPGLSLQRSFYSVHHAKRSAFPTLRMFLEHLQTEAVKLPN